MVAELSLNQIAGLRLRKLIQANYQTQQEFADDYGLELRAVRRYINQGITKVSTIQELAFFFGVDASDFFRLD